MSQAQKLLPGIKSKNQKVLTVHNTDYRVVNSNSNLPSQHARHAARSSSVPYIGETPTGIRAARIAASEAVGRVVTQMASDPRTTGVILSTGT